MSADASEPASAEASYRSWIDAPADGRLPSAFGVLVGWCYRRDGVPVAAIRARIGAHVFPGRYGLARPDVSATFGGEPGSADSGFDIPVLVPDAATFEIEAQTQGGSWEPVQTCVVVSASPMCSQLEEPAGGAVGSTHVVLRGWCFHAGGAPVTAVRARIGRRVLDGVYGSQRPDVRAWFGAAPAPEACGFEIPVVIPAVATEASSTCEVAVQLSGGPWQVIHTIALRVPSRARLADAIKWSRLWLRSWLGWPGTWEDLSLADCDYALGVARRRRWFNLDTVPQYAPRAIEPERFPVPRLPIARLPRLVVVTPSYQQAPFLEQTMQSVLNQEGVNIEYIVQDGGSTDGSVAVIQRHASRLTHWESARDRGQGDAIVRGFAKAALGPNDIMMYLNSDDIMMPGAARFVAEYFARHPRVDAVYGHRVLIDSSGSEVGRWITPRQRSADLRLVDFVPQETLFWRKRIWDRVGGIDPSFRFALDWDLLLRFQAAGARMVRLPWFLGGFRIHAEQKTSARLEEDGIPEMNALRLRTLGHVPPFAEIHRVSRRAQVDSALVYALLQRGWRV
jgi:Glycosyl transferase family 2